MQVSILIIFQMQTSSNELWLWWKHRLKSWKDIWGSGQGIGGIKDSPSVAELVGRIKSEYEQAFDEFKNRMQG